ncbi:restriction endonuclease subunit S [Providencia rustigianii]|uniref:restriction endonuclease subunit S n=1 Tax=Providencia rustigianii TaxID=158850 RepID=UPI00223F79FE|nr:restriction endonuclease subunit S [Providencia rustigianii]
MSELSYLEKLLDGVEVEWMSLGSIAEIYGGLTGKSKEDFGNGNARYISYKTIFSNLSIKSTPSDFVKTDVGERQNEVKYGDILFTGSSEIASEAGMSCAVTAKFEEPIYLNSFSFGVRFNSDIKITPEFAKYLFRTQSIRSEIAKSASGVTRFNISKARFKKILIPIPCPNNPEKSLAIQSEIVRILDKFTALTAELTAELTARKKQYNYYRDQLLSFDERAVEWKTLGELSMIGDGLHGTPVYDDNGDYYFINGNNLNNGRVSFNEKTKKVSSDMFKKYGIHFESDKTIFLSINGTVGNVAFYRNERVVLGKSVAFFKIKSPDLHLGYLFYLLQTEFSKKYFEDNKTGSTIKNLGLKALRVFKIPVPPLRDQVRIYTIMNRFDALANSITEGLPREIELRQKQYEYYRDLLFSFPKPELTD